MHVGTVLPSGCGWTAGDVEIRCMPTGPHAQPASIAPEAFRALVERVGGIRAAARHLGCGPSTISRYCSGDRVVPQDVLAAFEVFPDPLKPGVFPVP